MTIVQTRQLAITPLDLSDGADVRAWNELRRRCDAVDLPLDPLPTLRESTVEATVPSVGTRLETFLAREGERPVGALFIEFPLRDNLHTAYVDLWVDPAARRRGVGRVLHAHASDRARAHGRALLIGEVRRGSPGDAFVTAVGGELRLNSARRSLSLDSMDRDFLAALRAEAERHAAGYSLIGWVGAAPDEHVEGAATVLASMNDAPIDDLDVQDEVWDAARVRDMEERTAQRGGHRRTLVARHDASGEYAGLTEVMIRGEQAVSQAWQGATVVVGAHRGHRLGLLLKVAMLEQLLAEEPDVRRIDTWNADSNGPMLAINEQLGFRIADLWAECQAAVVAT